MPRAKRDVQHADVKLLTIFERVGPETHRRRRTSTMWVPVSVAVLGCALLSAAPAHADSAKTAPRALATRGGAVTAPLPFLECLPGTYQGSSGDCVPSQTDLVQLRQPFAGMAPAPIASTEVVLALAMAAWASGVRAASRPGNPALGRMTTTTQSSPLVACEVS